MRNRLEDNDFYSCTVASCFGICLFLFFARFLLESEHCYKYIVKMNKREAVHIRMHYIIIETYFIQ